MIRLRATHHSFKRNFYIKMEAAALARKERLKQLKAHAQSHNFLEEQPQNQAETLPNEQSDISIDRQMKTAETEAEKLETEALEDLKARQQETEIDLDQLVPRKVDWDLKRDLEKKLARLDRVTRRKIVEMVKFRISDTDDNNNNGSRSGNLN